MPTFDTFDQPIQALVVGASHGIGLEFVTQLLAHKQVAAVHAMSRSATQSDGLAQLKDEHGERLSLQDADVCDESSLARVAEALKACGAQLNLIIYTSGLLHDDAGMFPERKLDEVKPDSLLKGFQVNAFGPVLCAKYFQKLLPRKAHCVIVHLSARVGSIGDNRLGGWYTYRASKAAQNMFTRNLAIELGRRYKKLACIALHPGTVDTQLSAPFQKNVAPEKLFSKQKSVAKMLDVIAGIGAEDNGRFFAYDGSTIPW